MSVCVCVRERERERERERGGKLTNRFKTFFYHQERPGQWSRIKQKAGTYLLMSLLKVSCARKGLLNTEYSQYNAKSNCGGVKVRMGRFLKNTSKIKIKTLFKIKKIGLTYTKLKLKV